MFHSLRGYDAHFLIQQISPADTTHVIENYMEKYISFSVNNLRFIDGLQFLPASLEKLANICKSIPRMMAKFNETQMKFILQLRRIYFMAVTYVFVDSIIANIHRIV